MKNTKKKYRYLIFKGAFLKEILHPNENVIRESDRVTSVWLESQLPIKKKKKKATPAIYNSMVFGVWRITDVSATSPVCRCDDRDQFSLPLISIAKIGLWFL